MKNLFDMEEPIYLDTFDNEIIEGDKVEWRTCGHTIIGVIVKFEKDKAVIKTTGCRYSTQEELEEIKTKAKRQYKVGCHRLIKLVHKDFYKNIA